MTLTSGKTSNTKFNQGTQKFSNSCIPKGGIMKYNSTNLLFLVIHCKNTMYETKVCGAGEIPPSC